MNRRIDFDPADGTALADLLSSITTARQAGDQLDAAVEHHRAETHAYRATGEAIVAARDAGYSARAIGQAIGMTHAAVTARERAARNSNEHDKGAI